MNSTKIDIKSLKQNSELLQKIVNFVCYGLPNPGLLYKKIDILSIIEEDSFLIIKINNLSLVIHSCGFLELYNADILRYMTIYNQDKILEFIIHNQSETKLVENNKKAEYSLQKNGINTWTCVKCASVSFDPYNAENMEFKYCPYCGSLIEGIE
jgi:hypothetical protein